jgi:hypothetical protein
VKDLLGYEILIIVTIIIGFFKFNVIVNLGVEQWDNNLYIFCFTTYLSENMGLLLPPIAV